jgi:hypothetical protein
MNMKFLKFALFGFVLTLEAMAQPVVFKDADLTIGSAVD